MVLKLISYFDFLFFVFFFLYEFLKCFKSILLFAILFGWIIFLFVKKNNKLLIEQKNDLFFLNYRWTLTIFRIGKLTSFKIFFFLFFLFFF